MALADGPTAKDDGRKGHSLAMGVIRGDSALIRVYSTAPGPGDRWIIAADLADGQVKTTASEAGASHSRSLDQVEAEMSPRRQRRLKLRPHTDDVIMPLDPDRFYQSLTLVRRRGGGRSIIRWLDDTSGLGQLLPETRDEFRGWLSFGNRRHTDAGTVRFICGQVLRRHAPTPRDPAIAGYVVNALVILIYKSIEIAAPPTADVLQAFLATATSALEGMSFEGDGVRSDREHLGISLQMALWHLALAQGDGRRALGVLGGMFHRYRQTEAQPLPVNRGYNVCRSLLMYGVLSLAAGRREHALEVLLATIEAFKRTVAAVDPPTSNLTWFTEMADTHRAAIHAMTLVRMDAADEAITPAFLVEMACAGPRVDSPAFNAAAERVILDLSARNSGWALALAYLGEPSLDAGAALGGVHPVGDVDDGGGLR